MYMKILASVAAALLVVGCTTVSEKTDKKTGIKTTVVAVRGCNNPSQTLTWVERPGKGEASYASSGGDICNTLVGAGAQVASAGILANGPGTSINNQNFSGSTSSSNQSTNIRLRSR